MSDTYDPNATVATEAPPPETAPPPAAAAPAVNGNGDQYLDGDLPDQPLFDLGFVKGLRESGARYRTAAREAEAKVAAYGVFERYEPDDRQVWFRLAETWERSPEEAAQLMSDIAKGVLGEPGTVPAPTESISESAEVGEGLSAERVQQMIAEAMEGYQRTVAQQQQVDQVFSEIRTAGIDPESDDGFMVLWYANNQTEGDIPKALDLVKAKRQSIIDDYVSGRSNQRHAGVAPGNGAVATSAPTHQESWEETRRAAQSFIASQPGS